DAGRARPRHLRVAAAFGNPVGAASFGSGANSRRRAADRYPAGNDPRGYRPAPRGNAGRLNHRAWKVRFAMFDFADVLISNFQIFRTAAATYLPSRTRRRSDAGRKG